MALLVCKSCKRAFISGKEEETLCLQCWAKLKALYPRVRELLRNNERRVYTVFEVSKILNVDLKDVKELVSQGMIESSTDGNVRAAPRSEAKLRPLDFDFSQEKTNEVNSSEEESSMHTYNKKQKSNRGRNSW